MEYNIQSAISHSEGECSRNYHHVYWRLDQWRSFWHHLSKQRVTKCWLWHLSVSIIGYFSSHYQHIHSEVLVSSSHSYDSYNGCLCCIRWLQIDRTSSKDFPLFGYLVECLCSNRASNQRFQRSEF